jgi:serine/threonine-protein kinase RsbW
MTTANPQVSGVVGNLDTTPARLAVKITSGGTFTGFDLPGVPEAASAVRSLLRRCLGDRATPDLLLCASELAANAIQHSRSGRPGGRFLVTVQAEGSGVVLVSVLDEGARAGQDRSAWGLPAEHGRGLGIVAALAIESGATTVFAGRLSWFRISVRDAAASGSDRDARACGRDTDRDAGRDGQRDTGRDVVAGRRSA